MDFNLSQICDMLGDRLEEYKNSSKKRRIERGSVASTAKITKFSGQSNPKNSTRRNGVHMYASTPVETPTSGSKQSSILPAMFSSVVKSPSLERTRLRMRKRDMNVRKLIFDGTEDSSDCEMGISPVETPKSRTKSFTSPRFASVTKIPSKRPHSKRSYINNIRKLAFDDEECDEEVGSSTVDSDAVTLSQERLSPVGTPTRSDMQMKSISNLRRISYNDTNCEDKVKSLSCENFEQVDPSLSETDMQRSNLKTSVLTSADSDNEHLKECLSSTCPSETTLIQDFSQERVMVLNVGIFIRPL